MATLGVPAPPTQLSPVSICYPCGPGTLVPDSLSLLSLLGHLITKPDESASVIPGEQGLFQGIQMNKVIQLEQNVWTLSWDLGQEETGTVPGTREH